MVDCPHDAPDPFVATVLVSGAVLLADALLVLLVCRLCLQ